MLVVAPQTNHVILLKTRYRLTYLHDDLQVYYASKEMPFLPLIYNKN